MHKICAILLFTLLWPAMASADARIEDLSWMDRNFLTQQVERIDNLARQRFGTPVRGNKSDLQLLQRIVDARLIADDDVQTQQALGIVLGNVMLAEVPHLEWKIYEDRLGRSRALCVRNTRECLFPVTMLSRRMELGMLPSVENIYNYALQRIGNLLPRDPYDATTPRR
jgi:hypothetical protein